MNGFCVSNIKPVKEGQEPRAENVSLAGFVYYMCTCEAAECNVEQKFQGHRLKHTHRMVIAVLTDVCSQLSWKPW